MTWRLIVSSVSAFVSAVGSIVSVAVEEPAAKVIDPLPVGRGWVLLSCSTTTSQAWLATLPRKSQPAGLLLRYWPCSVAALRAEMATSSSRPAWLAKASKRPGTPPQGCGSYGLEPVVFVNVPPLRRRRQIAHVAGIVAHHRIDTAEREAVAHEEK